MKERVFIAIDLKSFYASVECVSRGLDPLTTNLVVADESRTDKTICLAVTPSLKAYGLSGRSRLFEVIQKAAEIKATTGHNLSYIVAPPRMQLYMDYSSQIFRIYLKYISHEDIHIYSIDEVFIDATSYLDLYNMTGRELASTIIKDVFATTGITATAGVAPNLYLCKVAMDIVAKHTPADIDGVRIAELDEMTYRQFLWDHKPLYDFWRVGRGIAKRLQSMGIQTMGELARVSISNEEALYKEFGIDAEILIDHAWGIEPCLIEHIKAYRPKNNSISSGQVLSEPYDYNKARIIVREMTELLVLDLVDKGLVTSSVTLHINYDRINIDNGIYRGEISIDHYGRAVPHPVHKTVNFLTSTSSTAKICDGVLDLYDSIIDSDLYIRRITICANNVTKEQFIQYDLFTDINENEKEKKLQHAMLNIQKRYGKNAILKGSNLQEGATTILRNNQIGGHKA